MSPEDLNRFLLGGVNHTGSDIRITTGEVLNPRRAFPRQSEDAAWWLWEHVFKKGWLHEEHINAFELRSIFMALSTRRGCFHSHEEPGQT